MDLSKTEALGILQISEVTEAEEAYEQMLFSWKQKYLGTIPPIPILLAHIKKIDRLNTAMNVLVGLPLVENKLPEALEQALTLLDYFKLYHQTVMPLKLSISATENGYQLVSLLKQMINLQRDLNIKLATYAPEVSAVDLEPIKISSPSDLYLAQKELMEKEVPETEIMNYLSAEMIENSKVIESSLLFEVLKARKQIK